MVAYLARVKSAHMVIDVALHFQRSPMRMSQAIIQFENELRKDEQPRKSVEKLKEDLIKKGKKKYFIAVAWSQYKMTTCLPFPLQKRKGFSVAVRATASMAMATTAEP